MAAQRRAVFLDRDGVINRERGYVFRPGDFEFVPGTVQALRALREQGFALAVVSNQSGIARGYYSVDDYQRLSDHMAAELARHGVVLDGIEHCPHLPDAAVAAYRRDCPCRKPAPGMLLALAQRLDLDLATSVMVGDKLSDVQAGRAAGVGRCYLVRSGHPLPPGADSGADAVYDDLAACAAALAKTQVTSCPGPE